MNNDYISHYGIIGQKWGVLRYQNKDGTLTEAGKKRYAKGAYLGNKGVGLLNLTGNTARQGAYADYRVKQRGALQAITDEKNELKKNKIIRGATTAAIATGAVFALGAGSTSIAAAAGAAAVGKHFVNKYLNAKDTKNMNTDIESLKLAAQTYGVKRDKD